MTVRLHMLRIIPYLLVMSLTSLGTVVSIQENPFPYPDSFAESDRKIALEAIRRNVSLIFSAISKHHGASENSNPLMTTHVRNFPNASPPNVSQQSTVKPSDAPSLLFYYIFEDWATNYSLVARGEGSYGDTLNRLVSFVSQSN